MSKIRRSAIYTRKSTEEGLDQDFNSLDAQRDACAAYIKSQRQEGWRLVCEHFDDGAYSGAHMERPALVRLLEAIDKNRIDIVVVYKVDRLTRSLSDFARMVDLFDAKEVSFVSVTQQFNTTSSMGRLTLNVLLSFAQFEREVTAERIRDKIAASKKLGMWMGGRPPLGYDVVEKCLVINEDEANTVRKIFDLYPRLGTVRLLADAASELNMTSKRRVNKHGRKTGGQPITRCHLHHILTNPIYVGKIRHGNEVYEGRHEAIIDSETWQAVQRQLANNTAHRRSAKNGTSSLLLTGLAYDEAGDRLCPTYASKGGRRYSYYVSQRLKHDAGGREGGWRLPAHRLDAAVLTVIREKLSNSTEIVTLLQALDLPAAELSQALRQSHVVKQQFDNTSHPQPNDLVRRLIKMVRIDSEFLTVELDTVELATLLLQANCPETVLRLPPLSCKVPLQIRRRGVETKLIVESDTSSSNQQDPQLIALVARSHRWLDQLINGEARSVRDIASHENMDRSDVSRFLPLAFLSPDIVEAIMEGRQPVELTPERLKRIGQLPHSWQRQRHILKFSA